jgi:uncharacterized protein YeaO (DUF488 family)
MRIRIKQADQAPAEDDGYRILVECPWPDGAIPEEARIDLWANDLTPSDDLCAWFGQDSTNWDEFRRRYYGELNARVEELSRLAKMASQEQVTFVYANGTDRYNMAVALREFIEHRFNL